MKNMKNILSIVSILLYSFYANGQEIKGTVTDITGQAIADVFVGWEGETNGVLTNEDGQFTIAKPNEKAKDLIFIKTGFLNEKITVGNLTIWNVQLMEGESLREVTIATKSSSTRFANDIAKVEVLGIREIQRAACCSLAGCFSTNSNVDANTTNVITDAKELRLLGLAGVYNQILIEGMPLVVGIALPYGPGSYPGTMIEKIFITKGTNSVLQGFESISGQINIDFHQSDATPKWFLNTFANSFGESQYNINHMLRRKNHSHLSTVHLTTPATNIDRDGDGFRDIVRTRRMSAFHRWQYDNPDKQFLRTSFGIRYVNENREGGLISFDQNKHIGSSDIYGQVVDINHVEAYSKSNFKLSERASIILLAGAFRQHQLAYFGIKEYDATQLNVNGSLYLDYYYGTKLHNLKVGLSHRENRLTEDVKFVKPIDFLNYEGQYKTDYSIPGIFLENKYTRGVFTILGGMRMDHHGQYGWKATPRLLVRSQINADNDIRFSIGKGFRRAHVFAENQFLLASNRQLQIQPDLAPEEALNTGVNYIHNRYIGDTKLTLSTDLYHTYFYNQIFPDYNGITNTAVVDNYFGTSISNSFALEAKAEFSQHFDVKVAYNYLDVYRKVGDQKEVLPFVSKHKFIANTSYSTSNDQWQIDGTFRWYGARTLPLTDNYPQEYKQPSSSPSYSMLDMQVTRRWTKFQIYSGIENIFDFRQAFPILGYDKPFGQYFDPSFNWGPTKGREFFLGLRYEIADKK